MKVALDTNVLAYAEGVNGLAMQIAATDLIRKLPPDSVVLPAQALGELYNVLVRKAGRARADARAAILSWVDTFDAFETSAQTIIAAADLATGHLLGIWDAIILATAARAGCRLLLSQDLQDGFTWGGLTVTNPFSASPHALLSSLVDDR